MAEISIQNQTRGFKIGFGILLFFTAGNVFGHLGLLLLERGTIFIAWAAFNFLAAAILLIPYRRGKRWAWVAIWAAVVPYALIIFFTTQNFGPIYLAEAGLMTLGQILTYGTFFSTGSGG